MFVRLGVAAGLVLSDPDIEAVAGHLRLDPAVTGRAAIVERQVAIDDVGDDIGAAHCEPAHRIRLDILPRFEIILGAGIAVAEIIGTIENEMGIVIKVHDVRRRGAAQKQRRRARRVDEPVVGIERDREQRSLLPLEHVLLAVVVEPHLGRAAALGDQVDFLVDVLFRVERAGARDFDDVAAPFPFGAVKLDEGALAAQTLPGLHRQVEHGLEADVAEDRDPVGLHEQVVGRLGTAEFADAGPVDAGRLVPVGLFAYFVHDVLFPCCVPSRCRRVATWDWSAL